MRVIGNLVHINGRVRVPTLIAESSLTIPVFVGGKLKLVVSYFFLYIVVYYTYLLETNIE